MKSKRISRIICFPIIAILIIALLVVNVVAIAKADMINQWVIGTRVEQSEENTEKAIAHSEEVAEQIEGEGIILLKNEDDVLPLAEDTDKVNVFGWSSTQWVQGGSGSGRVAELETDLLAALKEQGISYNTELTKMYQEFQDERPYASNTVGTLNSWASESCRLYEPSVSNTAYYSEELLENAKEYSDTALVVIGRFAGESSDCPKVQYKMTEKDGEIIEDESRTYLDLSTEEEELLTYAGENFDKVIVVVNSPNAMSLAGVDRIAGIDACMLVGGTGSKAATAVPKVLKGEINPSGKTTDTYAYNLTTSSTYANSGETGVVLYTNGDGLYPADGETTNGNVGTGPLYDGVAYLDYTEGIYVGYKWYETADTEGYWENVSNEYGNGYEGVVQYPFGYGLSYTDFEWEIVDTVPKAGEALEKDSRISVTVRVTNVGETAGKDVVELYYTPPYTKGGIEKSSSNLAAFEKTKMLEPGESEELVLSFDAEDMASYDCYDANGNGFSGYELENGTYEIKVMSNAHEVADMKDAVTEYQVTEDIRYAEDSVTGSTVENQFTGEDAADGVSLDGSDSGADITYLTRADFAGTFPAEVKAAREMTDNIKELNLYTKEMADAWADPEDEEIVTGAKNELMLYEDDKVTELGLKLGADYDDEQWEDVLDQLTVDEMTNLVLHGYVKTDKVESVGKKLTKEVDGPAQIGSFNQPVAGVGFPNATVLAQTWNKQLAYDFGVALATEAGDYGYSGWYAPGLNMHRSVFGGRNYEYYSEDSYLTGVMGSKTVEGSLDAGIYVYVKHYAVYDQETLRDGLYTWLTEQALREIYLKPFKMIIQDGGATGMMTAYNRVGAVWAGGSEALMDLAREEWGYHGTFLTDYSDHHIYMNMDQALRAGGDLWMDGWLNDGTFQYETESNSFKQALRRASKNVLYMWLNAAYENASYNEMAATPIEKPAIVDNFKWWIPLLAVIDILAVIGFTLWIRRLLRPAKTKK